MMWKDEIVEEVRRTRDEYAARFNYDIAAICADIRQRQRLNKRDVVTKRLLFSENQAEAAERLKDVSTD